MKTYLIEGIYNDGIREQEISIAAMGHDMFHAGMVAREFYKGLLRITYMKEMKSKRKS